MTFIGQLITGNEVLYGKTRDTNGPFMGAHVRQLGSKVLYTLTCGDDRANLLSSLAFLSQSCQVILMTGGLGPTADDLTSEVVANFCGVSLEFREEAWQACLDAFARLGRKDVPQTNRKQAFLPSGSQIIPNLVGTAVGFWVTHPSGVRIFCLPGVPFELEPMFLKSVLPLVTQSGGNNTLYSWQVFALGESAMQSKLAEFEADLEKTSPSAVVSYQAHAGYVTYSVALNTLDPKDLPKTHAFFEEFIEPRVKHALGHYVVARSEKNFPALLVEILTQKKLKLSLAESCTGGLLSQMICAVPGASACFESAVVSYSNEAKVHFLGVQQSTLAQNGAVSEPAVIEMAQGSLRLARSQVSVSLSGVAGPAGGTESNPVGTVYLAISVDKSVPWAMGLAAALERFGWKQAILSSDDRQAVFTIRIQLGSRLPRHVIQLRAANFALGSLVLLAQLLCPLEQTRQNTPQNIP